MFEISSCSVSSSVLDVLTTASGVAVCRSSSRLSLYIYSGKICSNTMQWKQSNDLPHPSIHQSPQWCLSHLPWVCVWHGRSLQQVYPSGILQRHPPSWSFGHCMGGEWCKILSVHYMLVSSTSRVIFAYDNRNITRLSSTGFSDFGELVYPYNEPLQYSLLSLSVQSKLGPDVSPDGWSEVLGTFQRLSPFQRLQLAWRHRVG